MKNKFDNTQANREGWGVFCEPDGIKIQRLDDPQSIHKTYPRKPIFECDTEAYDFVRYAAFNQGSKYHKKAISLVKDWIKENFLEIGKVN